MAIILTRLKHLKSSNTFKLPKLHMCLSFNYGEQLLSIDWKERMKLFKLEQDEHLNFFNRHRLSHNSVYQLNASDNILYFGTSSGLITVRRPSLEEYVLLMRRGPAIAYPKDIWAIIGLLDIGPGSRVMEAGSGSGALTLHLSRLVSESGKVISFEMTEQHLAVAKRSVDNWAESLRSAGKSDQWTNNVEFHLKDVNECIKTLTEPVDAVVLDLVECRAVLKNVTSVTKQNGVIVAYVTKDGHISIEDTADQRSSQDPVEEIIPSQDPVEEIAPSQDPVEEKGTLLEELEEAIPLSQYEARAIKFQDGHDFVWNKKGFPNYIARPSHIQEPHSAFIVKLRRL